MFKKITRKFLLGFILALSVRSSRVNADLFAEGFLLDPLPVKPPKCRPCRPESPRVRILPKRGTQLGARKNNDPYASSFYEASLNCNFTDKQLQKKFARHAKDFEITGNYNVANRELFRRKLIEHMKSTHACIGTYRRQDVYHYYNPDTKINVMVNRTNDEFISGWLLGPKQVEHMELDGNIT